MTRWGGKEASERRSGIGEGESQGETAQDSAAGRSMKTFQFGEIGNA